MYIYIYICVYIHIHISTNVYTWICTVIHIHTFMYTNIYIYAYKCVYTHTHIYIYMYIYRYIYIRISGLTRHGKAPRPFLFTWCCHHQYSMAYFPIKNGRGEPLYCAIVWALKGVGAVPKERCLHWMLLTCHERLALKRIFGLIRLHTHTFSAGARRVRDSARRRVLGVLAVIGFGLTLLGVG